MKTLTSDEEVFNLDKLESKDAKEEYDSDPSDSGSDSGQGEEVGFGSDVEAKKRLKAEKREQKAARKKTSAPRKEKGQGTAKKKTKLPGQPKRTISTYFLWLNSEGRDKIKVYSSVHHIHIYIFCIEGGEPRLWRDRGIKEGRRDVVKAHPSPYTYTYTLHRLSFKIGNWDEGTPLEKVVEAASELGVPGLLQVSTCRDELIIWMVMYKDLVENWP